MSTSGRRGWMLGLGLLGLMAVAALLLAAGVVDEARDGWGLHIDGAHWPLLHPGGFDANLGSVLGLAVALLLVLIVVPLVLLLTGLLLVGVLGLVVVSVAAGLAAALAAVLLALALATSPLWLLGLLLWLALRPRAASRGYHAT